MHKYPAFARGPDNVKNQTCDTQPYTIDESVQKYQHLENIFNHIELKMTMIK